MIIEWTQDRILVVPCLGVSGAIVSNVTLLPGCNEIPDNIWAGARPNVKDKIDRGLLKELHTQIKETVKETVKEEIDPKTKKPVEKVIKEKTSEVKSKTLKELSAPEAEDVVKNTYNLKTLKDWKKAESRDSVRTAIQNQIDQVEKYGEERKKKKEGTEE